MAVQACWVPRTKAEELAAVVMERVGLVEGVAVMMALENYLPSAEDRVEYGRLAVECLERMRVEPA